MDTTTYKKNKKNPAKLLLASIKLQKDVTAQSMQSYICSSTFLSGMWIFIGDKNSHTCFVFIFLIFFVTQILYRGIAFP